MLAQRCRLTEGAVEKIEQNLAVPSYEDIKNFAAVLDVPEEKLMQVARYVKRL